MQAEASSQNLDQRLKGVNGGEGVPGQERPTGFSGRPEQARLSGFPTWCEPTQLPSAGGHQTGLSAMPPW